MPLMLSVGLSRKVGQPGFGSLGASCGVQVELDATLLHDDPEAFEARVRQAFAACRRAVRDELGLHAVDDDSQPRAREVAELPATRAQRRALAALAARRGVDLDSLVAGRHAARSPEELTRAEAGHLIDELQAPERAATA